VETAQFSGHFYGTSKRSVMQVLETRHCILDLDLQGVLSIRSSALFSPSSTATTTPADIGGERKSDSDGVFNCVNEQQQCGSISSYDDQRNDKNASSPSSSNLLASNGTVSRALYYYVVAPSVDELRQRLVKRNTESEEAIQTRLQTAERDAKTIRESAEALFDAVLVNGDCVEKTFRELEKHLEMNLA
jgi:guanylate kinase